MLKRIAFAVLLLGLAFRVGAADYTDMWYNPAESGWGVNVTQNGTTQFLTFFIYGQNGQLTCTGSAFSPGELTATIESFHQTGQGIEGFWTASTGGGCTETIHFAAVL